MELFVPPLSDKELQEWADRERTRLLGSDNTLSFDVEAIIEGEGLRMPEELFKQYTGV